VSRTATARWLAENGTAGAVSSVAPWGRTRGKHPHCPVDETRELVVAGRIIDPEQVDIYEAADALGTDTAGRRR
jgi:hypothetical protein